MDKLIDEINANHLSFVTKLSRLEERVNDAQTRLAHNRTVAKRLTNADIESEKQRLIQENDKLKVEVDGLVKKLTELEDKNKSSARQTNVVLTKDNTINAINREVINKPKDTESNKSVENKVSVKAANKPKKEPKKEPKVTDNEENSAIDASRLDLRVGRITSARKHPDADSLYVEQIDCGEEKPRTVVSGLVRYIPLEQMENRMVVILCNLKAAKMRGITSEAMVMCASTPDKVEILDPPPNSVPGDVVSFAKYPGKPDSLLNPKKKIWEQLAPDLKTDSNCVATYKGDPFVVGSKGAVKSQTLANVIVK